ncbi:MAG: hypothetical protein ACFE9I_01375 [Candidatus Hermodarchaeota archaeon]
MDTKIEKERIKIKEVISNTRVLQNSDKTNLKKNNTEIENICDENLITLQRIHAILLNCSNLSKKQKFDFCESERYFMKLYLKKLKDKSKKE